MKAAVVYHSETGNTAKVAAAMAGALGVEALPLDRASGLGHVDALFLGAAVYATQGHGVHPAVKAYIAGLEPGEVGRVVLFSTGFSQGGRSLAVGTMRGLLAARGVGVEADSFFCKGRFALFQLGHPNADELKAAADFARAAAGK